MKLPRRALHALLLAGIAGPAVHVLAANHDDIGADADPPPFSGAGYPNDPYFHGRGAWGQDAADQWALHDLRVHTDPVPRADPAAPVIVAVIDTGLDFGHEDFAAERLWRNPAETGNRRDDDGNGYRDDLVGWDFVDDDNNPWDSSGHGTHIAGIIAACTNNGVGIAGVNGAVRIMPLKVANFSGQARSSAVAAAIHYAVDHHARIINLSLGGELVTDLEREAAERAAEAGVLIVVAAGNKGLDTARFGYPSLPGVLVVGASDSAGGRAGFSNFGSHLDLLAPGVDILSLRAADTDFIGQSEPPDYPPGAAFVGDTQAYYRASGSSFAAALVSGIASRLIAARPDYHAAELRRVLLSSAQDVGEPGVDQASGHGLVNLVGALASDPSRFVEARLAGVDLSLENQQVWLSFRGSARADDLARAQLEVRPAPGAIAEPDEQDQRRMSRRERAAAAERLAALTAWQPLSEPITTPVDNAALGRRDLDSLMAMTGGATRWEVRLIVETAGGARQEAHLQMALPAPAPAADVGVDDHE